MAPTHHNDNGHAQKAELRGGAPLIVYGRPEDEFLHKRAAWSASFPVADRPVAKDELRQLRLVMLIEADQVGRCVRGARPGTENAVDHVTDVIGRQAANIPSPSHGQGSAPGP